MTMYLHDEIHASNDGVQKISIPLILISLPTVILELLKYFGVINISHLAAFSPMIIFFAILIILTTLLFLPFE